MASLIDSYLDELSRHLSHDPALARRMRAELADHFAEALGDRPSEAEMQRAVQRMGPARAVAATLAADGASRQVDRTWITLLVALVATFIAMRLRALWLPPLATDGTFAGFAAPLIDRWAFVAAIAAAAAGYWAMRPSPAAPVLALAALCASVAAGMLRIALAADWSAAPLAVAAATVGECALVGLLLAQILALRRRRRQATRLSAG
ncbi:MAG: hypothetical protein JNK84_08730 [Phreatobacter sp.]|uniref:HAAS signaling domain-containing protein n=1 Tax=Phreatobacter sp. TaxID=1966341 RepID=UPI001A55C2FA|nr:hypothetical protein [Phreatobacter sp.]MBL8569157.1 hypothetical protein [Phreatobacter sp.]